MKAIAAAPLLVFAALRVAWADNLWATNGGDAGADGSSPSSDLQNPDVAAAVAVLERQAARMTNGLRVAKREQLYAFDQATCACRSPPAEGAVRRPAEPVLLDDWVKLHCGGWGKASRCVARIVQDVRRFAPFNRTVDFAGDSFTEQAVQTLKQQALGYLQEHQDILTSLENVIGHLREDPAVRGVTAAEVADRIREARHVDASPDRTVALHVGLPLAAGLEDGSSHGLAADHVCHCFSVTQARALWDDAADTSFAAQPVLAAAPVEATLPDMPLPSPLRSMLKHVTSERQLKASEEQKEIDEETKLEEEGDPNFEHYVDLASRKYAKEHKILTWSFLLGIQSGTLAWEPLCDSGPLVPEYTTRCSGCHWAPSSNVYGQGYIFPGACLGIFYWDCCPYGCFTCSPGALAYSGLNPSGRQWPERTSSGSHPCKCSGSDGGANNEYIEIYEKSKEDDGSTITSRRLTGTAENEDLYSNAGQNLVSLKTGDRVFFAPNGHVYDARLVEALYSFAEAGVIVKAVTLFTTRLEQMRVLGWNPTESQLQHLGVTLELSKPMEYQGLTCRFLTLEMMAGGLMWTVGATAAPGENYEYQQKQTLRYDDLSPAVVARYLAGQRGRTYLWGKTDCQTVALELAQRLALHGRRRLQSSVLSVHAQVIHPAQSTAWPERLAGHIKALLHADETAVQVLPGEPLGQCPTQVGALKAMSEDANRAWRACDASLTISTVVIGVHAEHLDELITVLDVLSDGEGLGEGSSVFFSLPRVGDPDLEHGPSFAEWKGMGAAQFDSRFAVSLLAAALILAALVWVIRKLALRLMRLERESARAPWRRHAAPAVFLLSLLSGTVLLPVAAGTAWHLNRKKQDQQPGYDEPSVEAGEEAEGCIDEE